MSLNPLYPELPNTAYPGRIDIPAVNVNMDDRVNYRDYVEDIDFNTLRDAVLAIQKTLGEMPMGLFGTVKGRFEELEKFNTDFYDARYGGAGWKDIKDKDGNLTAPTILGHRHDGKNNPSQIELSTEVTGKLPKHNILLKGQNALTASDIYVDGATTITTALNSKLNTSGGTVTGNLSVEQDFETKGKMQYSSFFEANTSDFVPLEGTIVTLNDAWQRAAIKNKTKGASGTDRLIGLCEVSCNHLRYGDYAAIFRIKINWDKTPSSSEVIELVAISNTTEKMSIPASKLKNGWNSLPLKFSHNYKSGNQVKLRINYNPTQPCNIHCDGVVVTPMHTAVLG